MYRSKVNIYIISNSKDAITTLKDAVKERGYTRIEESHFSSKLLTLLQEKNPQIIIFDIDNVPSGKEKALKLKKDYPIPFVYVTDKESTIKLDGKSTDEVVIRPFDNSILDLKIELAYYKNRCIREVERTESKEGKINKKLQKEIKLKSFYEKQILHSKQLYYSSFNTLDDAVFLTDPDLNIILENKALKELKKRLGIKEETLGNSVDVFAKISPAFSIADYILTAKTGEEIHHKEIKIGKDIIASVRMKPVFDEEEMVSRVITIIKDITHQVVTSRKIKEQNQSIKGYLKQQKVVSESSIILNSLEKIEERLTDVLMVLGRNLDLNRTFIYIENKEEQTFEKAAEWHSRDSKPSSADRNVLTQNEITDLAIQFVDKEYLTLGFLKKCKQAVCQKFLSPDTKEIIIAPLAVNDKIYGFLCCEECIASRTWKAQEKELIKSISGILVNSLQRQKINTELIESGQRMTAIVTAIPDFLIHLDKNGKVLNVKKSREGNVNPYLNEYHDKNIREIYEPEIALQFLKSIYECIYKTEKTIDLQYEIEGVVNDFEARFEKINDQEVIAILRNVSEQKAYEKNLKEAKEIADKANKSKDRLFSIISHDIKNPLATLKSLLDLVIHDVDRLSKENLKKCFLDIQNTTDATIALLQNLLQWSRKELDNVAFEPGEVNIAEIIKTNITLYQQTAEKKQIILKYHPGKEETVWGDKNMLDTTVRNLINNAIKFSHKESEIIVHTSLVNKMQEVAVQDFGVGIKEEDKDKILSKSEIVTTRGTGNEKGTGVGLDLCNDFVIANKGKFWFESEAGKGSTFFFTVPLASKVNLKK